ncbi:MAG TPA: hypothetical protein VIV40_38375 [Kofleriaceae bacterium]
MPTKQDPKLPPAETDDDNVVRQENSKGEVRPDGPGDETAPVKPEPEKQRERREGDRAR